MNQVVKNLFSVVLEWLFPEKEFPIVLILISLLASTLIVIIPPEMGGLALAPQSNWISLILSSGASVTKSVWMYFSCREDFLRSSWHT